GKKAHDKVSAKESIRSQRRQIEKLCPFEWLKFVRDLALELRPIELLPIFYQIVQHYPYQN
ncbi:hypothetical protein AB4238_07555, partial [Shewanella sp. 10N.286.45.A1]|uniref:hypothetical protein n=1 Tax=Shewanella sp. 10N.286.45.A1 TaxID=3229694 RepID=UPI00354CA29D